MSEITEIGGVRVLRVPPAGDTVTDAGDLIGDAFSVEANLVAIPVERLDAAFFDLRSGIAGEMLQKFANYGIRCAIVGDISDAVARSAAFRDLVREADRGNAVLFVPDVEALHGRLRNG